LSETYGTIGSCPAKILSSFKTDPTAGSRAQRRQSCCLWQGRPSSPEASRCGEAQECRRDTKGKTLFWVRTKSFFLLGPAAPGNFSVYRYIYHAYVSYYYYSDHGYENRGRFVERNFFAVHVQFGNAEKVVKNKSFHFVRKFMSSQTSCTAPYSGANEWVMY
jgi:hypothetical protein